MSKKLTNQQSYAIIIRARKLTSKHFLRGNTKFRRRKADRREVDKALESVRFEKFTLLIDGIHKSINKIKFDTAPYLGVKSVHVFWVYELSLHPEGLTAAEIAAVSMVDRSLVSREIAALKKDGYVESEDTGKKRSYNARITLTDKGRELAEKITKEAIDVQSMVDVGVSEKELENFYSTLEKLYANFASLASGDRRTI